METYTTLWLLITLRAVRCLEDFTKAPLECKKTSKGAEYRGTQSITGGGLPCQRWDEMSPHVHSYNNTHLFPDASLVLAGSTCRNPAGVKARPWCFTTDPAVRWQYCQIPDCGCRKSQAGWDYTGKISVTSSGRRCQAWVSQTPHAQSYSDQSAFPDASIELAGDYCRNPDRWETKGPWCYTSDPQVRWEYCNVPYCECKVSPGGNQYGGKISRTRSGRRCQRWDSQTPHAHRYNDKECAFPDDVISNAANYCRNPEPNELGGPWCFTTDPEVRWEYCDIDICEPDPVDVHTLTNRSVVAVEDTIKQQYGITRVELLFAGLFAASLLLTFTTIIAAIIVVRVYRKRNKSRGITCAHCHEESLHVTIQENLRNASLTKQHYEHGEFGDTVYVTEPPLHDHVTQHTYDTISSAPSRTELAPPSRDLKVPPRDKPRHSVYENSQYHVIISPKSGQKQPKFERSSSFS